MNIGAKAGLLGALAAVSAFLNINAAYAVPVAAASLPAQPCYLGASTQNQIQGFSFTPTIDMFVTSLGVTDCNMDGLTLDTPVGLFDSDGASLAQLNVAAGLLAPLEGALRFSDIAPVKLIKGMEYRILSFMLHDAGEPALLNPQVTFAPEITINGFIALHDGGNHNALPGLIPDRSPFCCNLFGPSFKFEPVPISVPEPSAVLLFAIGLVALALGLGQLTREFARLTS